MCAISTMKYAPISRAISDERRVVHRARIGTRARDDELRAMFARERAHLVVIDQLGIAAHAVCERAIELAAEADLRAVREMAAVRERHAEDRVARARGST